MSSQLSDVEDKTFDFVVIGGLISSPKIISISLIHSVQVAGCDFPIVCHDDFLINSCYRLQD